LKEFFSRKEKAMTEEKITEGVRCVVNTCGFYKEGDVCTAGKIEIKPRNASTAEETDCATFTPGGSMK